MAARDVLHRSRSAVAWILALLVAAATLLAVDPARADTAPRPGIPATVSTDPLPTAQINGVVWTQLIVGTTVYAGGRFTAARPAGAAAGVNVVARSNLLAYDLATGALTSFSPVVNGEVNALAASPDGSRLYIGGAFTSINGTIRNRVAAFDTATGALVTGFAPSANSTVQAIAAIGSTVYLGGNFTAIGSTARTRLAAVNAADGTVLASFAPSANGRVRGVAVSPDQTRVVAAGSFTTLNGSANPGYGLGAVDATTGALLPFAANSQVRNGGSDAAIYSMTSDADGVYGVGYHFGAGGNLEGAFRADWAGNLIWVEDCHGDTYSGAIAGDAFYTAGHPHYCGTSGGFPQTSPWSFQRGMAWSKAPSGNVNNNQTLGYASWAGTPVPTLLNWWPDFNTGTATGSNQGPWSVAANADYVVYGGEFTRVNGVPQQGLVRFAVRNLAPNADGPRLSGTGFPIKVTSPAAGAVNVSWVTNYDRDNQFLTYEVLRGGAVVHSAVGGSRIWWDRPTMSFYDVGSGGGLAPGTYTYQVRVRDDFGNTALSPAVQIAVPSGTALSPYANAVLADGASAYWRLGETTGTTVTDTAGTDDAVGQAGLTRGRPGAVAGDGDRATAFSGTSTGSAASQRLRFSPNTFTVEAWFQTTSTAGGKIIGLGSARTGNSGVHDRSVYVDGAGRVFFGVYNGARVTVQSGTGFNDGRWHHVVATLGPDGMRLFLDGAQVAQRAGAVTPDTWSGYWRIGGDSSWAGNGYLNGTLDEVAVYDTALPAASVLRHFQLATGAAPSNAPPTASFSATPNGLGVTVDAAESADTDGTIQSYSWSWGDGAPDGTGVSASHTYATGGTYPITLTVTDDDGSTATATRSVTVAAAAGNAPPTASFTVTSNGLGVSVDGSASSDPDGDSLSYEWAWGDSTAAGSGVTATHTYEEANTYTITLTVRDGGGATAATTRSVTVSSAPPPAGILASDDFNRVTTNGWGSAQTGGAWTLSTTASMYSADGAAGRITSTRGGQLARAFLTGVSSTSTDVQATIGAGARPVGGSLYISVVGRRLDDSNDYRARLVIGPSGQVNLQLQRGGTYLANIVAPGLTYNSGDRLRLRLQVTGTLPTTVRARVWKVGAVEPTTWPVTASDVTPSLQVPGHISVDTYVSGSVTSLPVVVTFDDLVAAPVQ